MLKRVDTDVETKITGFSYLNQDGCEESVSFNDSSSLTLAVSLDQDSEQWIYKEDIPKLIKALQAAYDFKGN
jgi:hypothetical protein